MAMNPVGIIKTPFTKLEGMPIQPKGAIGVEGTIEIFPEFELSTDMQQQTQA